MATPLQNQALLPPPAAPHGSWGPAISVVVVIAVLGVVAGLIGRICSGRTVMGYGHFDVEAWMDSKFSSCIDGHVDALPPRRFRHPPTEEPPAPAAGAHEAVEAGEEGEVEHSHS